MYTHILTKSINFCCGWRESRLPPPNGREHCRCFLQAPGRLLFGAGVPSDFLHVILNVGKNTWDDMIVEI